MKSCVKGWGQVSNVPSIEIVSAFWRAWIPKSDAQIIICFGESSFTGPRYLTKIVFGSRLFFPGSYYAVLLTRNRIWIRLRRIRIISQNPDTYPDLYQEKAWIRI